MWSVFVSAFTLNNLLLEPFSFGVDAAGSKNGFLYAAGPRIAQLGGVQIPFILHRSRVASQREKRSECCERDKGKGKRKEGKTKKKQEKKRKNKEKKQDVF